VVTAARRRARRGGPRVPAAALFGPGAHRLRRPPAVFPVQFVAHRTRSLLPGPAGGAAAPQRPLSNVSGLPASAAAATAASSSSSPPRASRRFGEERPLQGHRRAHPGRSQTGGDQASDTAEARPEGSPGC